LSLVNIVTIVAERFQAYPFHFFTEHDIHSELACTAHDMLHENERHVHTLDQHLVNRIHHEYPTPFRCDMRGTTFRKISEEEFKQERQNNPRFRANRGFLDFVILNQQFIESNELVVVSGKRYHAFLKKLDTLS
jgi:hypothetical protein